MEKIGAFRRPVVPYLSIHQPLASIQWLIVFWRWAPNAVAGAMPKRRCVRGYGLVPPAPCAARCAWYAFHPGHQPVCHFHNRDMKDLGLASAFARAAQVSQG